MRFMWESNAPWAGTGYGGQTRNILRHLQQTGLEPHCFAFYGLHGGRVIYDGYECWPNSDYDQWGNDVVGAHIENSKAEALVTLMDIFVLRDDVFSKLKVPWLAWIPLDSEYIGHPTTHILQYVNFPIAMSQFGADEMLKQGHRATDVIWHCVDTDTFYPRDKAESRKELGIEEDAYVIGMVMANKGDRKQYPRQLEVVKRWMDDNPDRNIKVFMHTDPTHMMGGWDMKALVKQLGLKGSVYSTNQYFSVVNPVDDNKMAEIYSSFDVLMNVSAGEGFGIPIIEAQACGVPVVTGNWTAMPELTHYGYTVEPNAKILAHHYGYQFGADPDDMLYKLECVYRMASKSQGEAARAWVQANFSVPVIAEKWRYHLERLAQ